MTSTPIPMPALALPASANAPANNPGATGHRKKVLLVDDDKVLLKALSTTLLSHGYEVLTAQDGGDAIKQVRQLKPDLILLDLNFPPDVGHGGGVAWDGFLILSWLRRMDEAKDTPVILITAAEQSLYHERCRAFGVLDFFQKPLDRDKLLAAIAKVFANADEAAGTGANVAPKKVLFVDDEGDWRFMAAAYLEDCGYNVLTAKDSVEALLGCERSRPDVIILDLNLGGESGLVLLKEFKRRLPEVPVLLFSGMEFDHSTVQSFLQQGAHQFVRKSTLGELLKSVQGALAGVSS